MTVSTYHLDQQVRGLVSKDLINSNFLDKYYPQKHEAILPFALLEYAGIKIKEDVFLRITEPEEISLFKDKKIPKLRLKKIKESFDNQLKKKLPKKYVRQKLEEQLNYDNKYASLFIKDCIEYLSKSSIYELLIAQLSWDRFSQMAWCESILKPNIVLLRRIRKEIGKLIAKENHLYVLRHCQYLSQTNDFSTLELEEDKELLMKMMRKVKIKPNMDIGDCELIHVAINGQASENFKKRKIVDCYTMDNTKEIKRRLLLCSFFYGMLESAPIGFTYKFNQKYCGQIYILDNSGKEKEQINVKEYLPGPVLQRIRGKDMETLFLINN